MNPRTQRAHQAGVGLWLDNITRKLLGDGTPQHDIE